MSSNLPSVPSLWPTIERVLFISPADPAMLATVSTGTAFQAGLERGVIGGARAGILLGAGAGALVAWLLLRL